jgi:exopolysaccharide biosynthesis polyprenyl glycosylphosphotransferase
MPPRDLLGRESAGTAAPLPAVGVPVPALDQSEIRAAAAVERAPIFAKTDRDAVYRRFLAVADALAATFALLISIVVVSHPTGPAVFATVPVIVILSKVFGNYDREDLLVRKSTLDEAPALFQLATMFALTVWLVDGLLMRSGHRDLIELLTLWVTLFVLLVLFRATARSLCRWCTQPERCLVIGDAPTCAWMRTKFERRRSLHASVVASIPVGSPAGAETPAESVNGTDIQLLATRFHIDRILITPGTADEVGVVDVVHGATSAGLKVSVLPRVLEVLGTSVQFDDLEGVPLLSMRPLGLPRYSRLIKRSLDVVGSSIALVLLAPLLATIAIAIRFDSGRPVLFRQRRVGRDGKDFEMVKFRTMVPDADEHKDELRHLNQASGLFKIDTDPRITGVGRFLRRTSLDELPQLYNVLRGEMSLVGPRPLIAEEDRKIEGWRRRRLHLTPGMTGHWQILGSARLPLDEMMRIDYLYVTNWSLWLDVKILLRTLPYVLARRGM